MLSDSEEELKILKQRFSIFISEKPNNIFSQNLQNIANNIEIVDVNSNEYNEMDKKTLAVSAINSLLYYIEDTQKEKPENLNKIVMYESTKYMALDLSARRNLELTEKLRDKSKKGTLLWVLDKTSTSMGGRLLRRWISDPLVNVADINSRLRSSKWT